MDFPANLKCFKFMKRKIPVQKAIRTPYIRDGKIVCLLQKVKDCTGNEHRLAFRNDATRDRFLQHILTHVCIINGYRDTVNNIVFIDRIFWNELSTIKKVARLKKYRGQDERYEARQANTFTGHHRSGDIGTREGGVCVAIPKQIPWREKQAIKDAAKGYKPKTIRPTETP